MQLSTATRNAILSAVSTDVGSGGTLKIYTVSPANLPGVGNAATGTLLSTLTSVVFGTPSAGSMTVSATADTSAANTATPVYYRISTSGGTAKIEGSAGSGQELAISGQISLGGTVTLTSGSITAGNA